MHQFVCASGEAFVRIGGRGRRPVFMGKMIGLAWFCLRFFFFFLNGLLKVLIFWGICSYFFGVPLVKHLLGNMFLFFWGSLSKAPFGEYVLGFLKQILGKNKMFVVKTTIFLG